MMNTLEFEKKIEAWCKNEYDNIDEAVIFLSNDGNIFKEKIKRIIRNNMPVKSSYNTKDITKMIASSMSKSYDKKMYSKITSEIESQFPISFHTNIIKEVSTYVVNGMYTSTTEYYQKWVVLYKEHLYSFYIYYYTNAARLALVKEDSISNFKYPKNIIVKAIISCDHSCELKFSKNKISSREINGFKHTNDYLYDKLENELKKYPKISYKRTHSAIVFK